LAEHFIRQDNSEDQVAATASVDFRCGQKRRDHVTRMTRPAGATYVSVIEVEIPKHNAICERNEIRAALAPSQQHGRRPSCGYLFGKFDGDLAGLRRIRPKRTTHRVE